MNWLLPGEGTLWAVDLVEENQLLMARSADEG